MRRRALSAYERDLILEVAPGREKTADLTLWQLEHHGGKSFANTSQVVHGEKLASIPEQDSVEPMQTLVALLFMKLQMTGRMESNPPRASLVGVDAEGDLLRHRPADHEDGGRLSQDAPHLVLEDLDRTAIAVSVDPRIGRDLGQKLCGFAISVRVQRSRAGPSVSLETVIAHG